MSQGSSFQCPTLTVRRLFLRFNLSLHSYSLNTQPCVLPSGHGSTVILHLLHGSFSNICKLLSCLFNLLFSKLNIPCSFNLSSYGFNCNPLYLTSGFSPGPLHPSQNEVSQTWHETPSEAQLVASGLGLSLSMSCTQLACECDRSLRIAQLPVSTGLAPATLSSSISQHMVYSFLIVHQTGLTHKWQNRLSWDPTAHQS